MIEVRSAPPEGEFNKEWQTAEASAVCNKTNKTFEGQVKYRRIGQMIEIDDFSPLMKQLMLYHYDSGLQVGKDGKYIEFELFVPDLRINGLEIEAHMGWICLKGQAR